MLIKPTETTVNLSAMPSMEITSSMDRLHRPLAPLASSETFSDVGSIYRDEQQIKDLPKNNRISNPIIRNNDFDSLEILFDFPSVDLSNDSQPDILRSTENPCRIRFSDQTQIINTPKV